MAEIKATPRSDILGKIADMLLKAKGGMPQPFGFDTGALVFGNVPEELDRWSYGNSPFKSQYPGISGRLPELQESRKAPVADVLGMAPIPAGGASGAAKVSKAIMNRQALWRPRKDGTWGGALFQS